MQVIALCGYAGSGKDTAAQGLIELGWQRVSFADPIREMALAIDPIVVIGQYADDKSPAEVRLSDVVSLEGWDGAKKHVEVRRLLQRIGTEAGREILGEGIWVTLAERKIHNAAYPGKPIPGVVITDLRFANELKMLRGWNAIIVRISRPGVGPVNDHESDQLLASFEVDHELVNDGSEAKLQAALVKIARGD